MARVFLAEDLKHHRKVAIKVLHPDLAATVGTDRFLREIEIEAGLDHPHILSLLDSGMADGALYYVMPFVDGEPLRSRIERDPQLPIDEAIRIAREIADGLAYAHRHGVVHRDIKPANVLLADGHALIADFGVARVLGGGSRTLTNTGLAIGTPAYMSPEQASGGSVDARSDLYSLGCVLYEMLAGIPPLTGPTPQATVSMRLVETPTPLPVIRETVPDRIDQVTQKLLAKSPADRYSTAEELVEALDDPDLWSGARRERQSWKAAAAMAVGLSIVALLFVWAASIRFAAPASEHGTLNPRQIVVASLDSRGGTDRADLDFLATYWITEGLFSTGIVEVVPAGEALRLAQRVRRQADSGVVIDPALELAAHTGAGIVVSVAHCEVGDSIRFFVEITDAVRDRVLGMLEHKGASSDPEGMIEELRDRTMSLLSTAIDAQLAAPLMAPSRVPRYAAIGDYRRGIERFMASDYDSAGVLYLSAFDADTTLVEALLWAVFSMARTGDLRRSDSLLREVELRRDRLSKYHQAWTDSYRAWINEDMELALRYIRRASDLAPGSSADIHRALTALIINRPRESVEAMARVDLEHGLADGWLQPWVTKTAALHELGNHSTEIEAASIARRKFPDHPYPLFLEARALVGLGLPHEALARVTEMLGMPDSPNTVSRRYLAAATGAELRHHGYEPESEAALELAVRFHEPIPLYSSGRMYPNPEIFYGHTLYLAERWPEAERFFSEAGPLDAHRAGFLGLIAARRGDLDRAKEMEDWLQAHPAERGHHLMYVARIAAVLGERARAVTFLGQAFDAGLHHPAANDPPGHQWLDWDFESMRDYEPYRDLIRPKG
jgi:tetratricopeptide (TPR) repeat protein